MHKSHLLFVAHRLPYPENKGEKIRAFQWIKTLSAHYNVHVVAPYDDIKDEPHTHDLQNFVYALHTTYLSSAHKKWQMFNGLLRHQPLSVACFAHKKLQQAVLQIYHQHHPVIEIIYSIGALALVPKMPIIPRFFDMVDVDSAKFNAYAQKETSPVKKYFFRREQKLLQKTEKEASALSKKVYLTSEAEVRLFKKYMPHANAESMPHGIAIPTMQSIVQMHTAVPPIVTFIGSMDYVPNYEAMLWWHKHVMPLLPIDVRCMVVGRHPPETLKKLNCPRFTVLGGVPDVQLYIAQSMAVIAPLQIARGIQNKVLEGAAAGKPVIVSPEALEGLEALKSALLVARTPQEYVNHVLWLRTHAADARVMAIRLQQLAWQHFSPAHTGRRFLLSMQAAL